MRAGEMDDVIFAGTAGRPSRNLAEVTLTLDDTAGAAPPPYHEQAELEIVRRIERGSGSEYRVNGKEVRARDVQTLFADLATGAHASGMVSQGRVGALVTAKPEDRRAVLEEAAGITGLHARRHEAELKLRAAETNLARADDLRGQLEVQLGALKRQARQASRYRNISGAIRQAEAELLAIQRACAAAVRAEAEAALHAARMAVAAATEAATQAATQAAEAAAALPPLRDAEADARTALERHRVAQEQIAAEEERARAALADATTRLGQLGQDLAHAEQLRNDSVIGRVAACRRGCGAGRGRPGPPCPRGGRRVGGCAGCRRGPGRGGGSEPGDRCSRGSERPRPEPWLGSSPRRSSAGVAWSSSPARPARSVTGSARRRSIPRRSRLPAPSRLPPRPPWRRRATPWLRPRRRRAVTGPALAARARAAGGGGYRAGQACRRSECAGGSAGGEGWRAVATDGRRADRSCRAGDRARRGVGRGTDLGRRPWRGAALARTAAIRPGTQTAGRRDAAGGTGRCAAGAGPGAVADRAGGRRRHRRGIAGRAGAGPGPGLARRRRLALGRLHDPGRHADRGGGPAAAAQPAVAAAARSGRCAR